MREKKSFELRKLERWEKSKREIEIAELSSVENQGIRRHCCQETRSPLSRKHSRYLSNRSLMKPVRADPQRN